MKLDIEINEDEIVRLAVDKIAENLVKKYTAESRGTEYGIREGTKLAVINMVYENKDEIIEKIINRAVTEMVKKGMPKLIERMSKL